MEDTFTLAFGEAVLSDSGSTYTAIQPLGEGGNAATLLMHATAGPFTGIPFAVKFFRRLSKPEWQTAFLREADFLAACNHPAVMRYFDRGVARNTNPFFVAEYLPRTLREVLRAGRIPTVTKLNFATQLLAAIVYLADRTPPVIHRDIKPENTFIKGDSCVLGDFGLIKLLPTDSEDRAGLKESAWPGMPRAYRTPELVRYLRGEAPPSVKSDVYQLGLVFAELFTGRNPQRPVTSGELHTEIVMDELLLVPGSQGPPVRNLIVSMLAPEADKRPTASALLPAWQGLFAEVAKQVHALDGRVF
jgi:serine/threonine-protein kinase